MEKRTARNRCERALLGKFERFGLAPVILSLIELTRAFGFLADQGELFVEPLLRGWIDPQPDDRVGTTPTESTRFDTPLRKEG